MIRHGTQFFFTLACHGSQQTFAWVHFAAGQAPCARMPGIVAQQIEVPIGGGAVEPHTHGVYNTSVHYNTSVQDPPG